MLISLFLLCFFSSLLVYFSFLFFFLLLFSSFVALFVSFSLTYPLRLSQANMFLGYRHPASVNLSRPCGVGLPDHDRSTPIVLNDDSMMKDLKQKKWK